MDDQLKEMVRDRAHSRCEYCLMPEAYSVLPYELEHIIARKHGGRTEANNLAYSCFYDNSFKGPNIAGLDPKTGKITGLFHPRRHRWNAHFRWKGAELIGRTAIGRTTIAVLSINHPLRVDQRRLLMEVGLFPKTGE
ncbi:MAG: HNH endonuclease signature motif containing protein [Gemmatales bacterium]